MSVGARWLYHPQPEDDEAMSSWIGRLAACYSLPPVEFVASHLDAPGLSPNRMDTNPPEPFLLRLAEGTGVGVDQLRAMTISGLPLWRLPTGAKSYVGEVVLAASTPISMPSPRLPAWIPPQLIVRACPECLSAGGVRYSRLTWRVPLLLTCVEHRRSLTWSRAKNVWAPFYETRIAGFREPGEAHFVHDRRTVQALQDGHVDLPNGRVTSTMWFSMFHRLLEELISPALLRHIPPKSRAALGLSYDDRAAASESMWRQFESLTPQRQMRALYSAALTFDAIDTGRLKVLRYSPATAKLGPTSSIGCVQTIFLSRGAALAFASDQKRFNGRGHRRGRRKGLGAPR